MREKFAKAIHFIKQYILPYLPLSLIVAFLLSHLFILKDNSYIDICENDTLIRRLKQEIAQEETMIKQLHRSAAPLLGAPTLLEKLKPHHHPGSQQPGFSTLPAAPLTVWCPVSTWGSTFWKV